VIFFLSSTVNTQFCPGKCFDKKIIIKENKKKKKRKTKEKENKK